MKKRGGRGDANKKDFSQVHIYLPKKQALIMERGCREADLKETVF